MSLRVLLADESDTIKKVFQLALQDLQAEVKSVHSGLDVIDVAQSFQPQIIFADVLLQKKNGYAICSELKQHATLKNIPVILMWSSFMELDQNEFKKSRAEDQLEKPFDADYLRDLVKKHVQTVTSSAPKVDPKNPMAAFLSFPKKSGTPAAAPVQAPKLPEVPHIEEASEFNPKGFTLPELSLPSETNITPPPAGMDDGWKSTDLAKFKVDKDSGADSLDQFEALNLNDSKKATSMMDDKEFSLSIPNLEDILKPSKKEPTTTIKGSGPAIELPPPADEPEMNIQIFEGVAEESEEQEADSPLPKAFTDTASKVINTFSADEIEKKSGIKPPPGRGPAKIAASESEIEAIVRAHAEEFIKTEIKDSLYEIMEKLVRQELNKVLDEEVQLKQELGRDS